jgi:hypothetical protein
VHEFRMRRRTHSEGCVEHGYWGRAASLSARFGRFVGAGHRLMPLPPHRWQRTTLSPFLSVPFPSQFLHFCFFWAVFFCMASSYAMAWGEVCGAKGSSNDRTCLAGQPRGSVPEQPCALRDQHAPSKWLRRQNAAHWRAGAFRVVTKIGESRSKSCISTNK